MDTKYLEKELIKLNKFLFGENEDTVILYGQTDNHSCGFNKLELYYEDGELDSMDEEGCEMDINTLDDLIEVYPKTTMNKEYAFYGKFVTWKELEKAFKGEMEIDFVSI